MRDPRTLSLLVCALLLASSAAAQRPGDGQLDLTPEQKYVGEPISLSLKDADLVEVLRSFADLGGFNLIIQPGVKGSVTVELKDVPWDQALAAILKIHGLGMEITGPRLDIGTPRVLAEKRAARAAAMVELSLELRHADARVVARTLRQPAARMLGPGGAVWADGRTNKLFLRETRVMLRRIGRLLAQVDVPAAAEEEAAHLEQRCLELAAGLLAAGPG